MKLKKLATVHYGAGIKEKGVPPYRLDWASYILKLWLGDTLRHFK